ncbi:major facilitator superfamily transporter [Coniochaeta sp. 2T2.1]|nr:major facilitator superfamily transporter [Coniochaeta sp. 2T2.1]
MIEAAPPRPSVSHNRSTHKLDAAAELLRKVGGDASDRIIVTPADDKRVLRKIDLVLLPLMLGVYFLQQLDKATLAYSSVFGLITDTHLVGKQYSWLGSIVYLAQLGAQPVVAWLLVKLPIGKFSATMVLFWGITLSCMAAAHNFGGLLAARFFLGAFEASIAPAFVAITQMWWRRREQTIRVASWYAMNGVTNMVGSLITYGLGHINGSLKSYQIIFLFFGLITVSFSFVMFWFMPDSPVEAKFLKDHDKIIAIERLRANNMGVLTREWRWDHTWEALRDVKTWCWFCLMLSISIPSGGISTFGPLIVQSFQFSSFDTILLNIPFGAVQLIATMGGAFVAMKIKRKGPVIIGLCVPPIIGCVMLMVISHDGTHKGPLLVGYYLISVYPGISPLIYSWGSQNTAGDTKRKVVNGIFFIGQSVGNVVGPQLYTTAEKPRYSRGLRSNVALFVVIIVICCITTAYLMFLNKKHANRRVALGKSAVVYDNSLDSVEEIEKRRVAAGTSDAADADNGDKAFENMTDLENEDFVFVY